MAIPSSGAVSLSAIQTEFGGSNPISMSEYYAGGSYVPAGTSGTYGAVPSSGAIQFNTFHGTSAGYNYWYLNQTTSSGPSHGASGIDGSGNLYTANNGSTNAPTFSKVATLGGWQFSRKFTSGFYTQMATASSGNSYIAGVNGSVGFVVKYNSSGTLQWQRSVSSASGTIYIDSICVDPSENVYIMGQDTNGPVMFVICFNSSGTKQWGRQLDSGPNIEARAAITYYDAGTSTGVAGLYMVGLGAGGLNNMVAFTYSTSGVFNGAVSLAAAARGPANDYIGISYASPYFAFAWTSYINLYNQTYQTLVTFNGTITWQKELTNGGYFNTFNSVTTDGSNFYASGQETSASYGLGVVKFTNSGTVSSQRTVTAITGTGSSITSDGSVLSIGSGDVSSGSYLTKAPINMAFGTSAGRTVSTSTWGAGTATIADAAGTQTTATSAYSEAAYTPTQTLTQLT